MKEKNLMSRDLVNILRKNGLDAEVIIDNSGRAVLNVAGNRGLAQSPPIQYELTNQQLQVLANAYHYGVDSKMKKAYDLFNSIVAKDFMPPQNYTLASQVGIDRHGGRNRLTPINMGWNGVNERIYRGPNSPMRRIDNRADGSLIAGEARSMRQLPGGVYAPTAGYVWKGNLQQQQQQEIQQPVGQDIVEDIKPVEAPRPEDGQAVLLKYHVSTAGNDTYQTLMDILDSHGIVIKEGKDPDGKDEKQLVIKARDAKVNITYHLTDEEFQKLTANNWITDKNNDLQKRLDIINERISQDFKTPITKDMLNGPNYVPLEYQEGRREVNEARYIEYENRQRAREEEQRQVQQLRAEANHIRQGIANDPNAIDGRDVSSIIPGKAFFMQGNDGRQTVVGEIRVNETPQGKYTMSAEIDGRFRGVVISKKEYNRFLDYDDRHRLEMFADKFDVKIKSGEDRSWDIVRGEKGLQFEQFYRIGDTKSASVNENILQQLNKGFYAEQKGGRAKAVTDIMAIDTQSRLSHEAKEVLGAVLKENGINSRYIIGANIEGQEVWKPMTEKQYREFMEGTDEKRLKVADKLFDEFKIKKVPGAGEKAHAGKTFLNILGGITGLAVAGLSIKHDIDHIRHGHGNGPHMPPFHGKPREERYPQPFVAAQRSMEMFERIAEDVTVAAETIENGRHI